MSYDLKPNSHESNQLSAKMRFPLCFLILILSILLVYQLYPRFVSQIHHHQAKNLLLKKYYGLALSHLRKAIHYQPGDYGIQRELGNTCYKLAELKTDPEGAFLLTRQAKDYYLKSIHLNPLDAATAYGLARGESKLERMHQYFHQEKKNNPYHPLPYFKRAITLNPYGMLTHYIMARYLYRHQKEEELLSTIRTMARIYPSVHWYLEKEVFWGLPVKEAFKTGLQQAIDQNTFGKEAHKAMSYFLAGEEDWPGAISHYTKALQHQVKRNDTEDFIELGRLYLNNGQFKEAETSFLTCLKISRKKEEDLERLYYLYKRENYTERIFRFYQHVSERFTLSSRMNIFMARSLIDLKRYYAAQQILIDLNQKDPTAEAYYLLARIAKAEDDWDNMELTIQKATVLDPMNSKYHLLFSRVLYRLRKLARAEEEADLAIKHQSEFSPWFFDHRAWIRWDRKNYSAALQDWKAAIKLESNKKDKAYFYAQTAEAFSKLGDLTLAIDYYQKAVELDPENKKYQKRFPELSAESS